MFFNENIQHMIMCRRTVSILINSLKPGTPPGLLSMNFPSAWSLQGTSWSYLSMSPCQDRSRRSLIGNKDPSTKFIGLKVENIINIDNITLDQGKSGHCVSLSLFVACKILE